jgi:hypothetical protein
LLLGVACAPRSTPHSARVVAPRPALDSAAAHRLCTNADSAAVGRSGCELRDQRRPPRVF